MWFLHTATDLGVCLLHWTGSQATIVRSSVTLLVMHLVNLLIYLPAHFSSVYHIVSMMCGSGWRPAGCNLIHPRLKSCGVHLQAVNSRLQPDQRASVTRRCLHQLLSFATAASTWMLMSPWLHTSPPLLERALQRSGRYAVCGLHCRVMTW